MSSARSYAAADRVWVEPLIGATAIDAKQNRIEVIEDGASKSFAIWHEPEDEDGTPMLGPVIAIPENRKMFYAALLAVIEALVDKGYRTGTANIADERVVKMLKRDLGDVITVTPMGRNVKTDKTASWQIDVDPPDALAVLRGLV